MKRPACGAIRIAVLVLAVWIGAESGLAQTGDEQTSAEAAPAPSMPASPSFRMRTPERSIPAGIEVS